MTCQLLNEYNIEESEYNRFEFDLSLSMNHHPRWFFASVYNKWV